MSAAIPSLRFGTRGSILALWQTKHVMTLLQQKLPSLQMDYEIIRTHGDAALDTPLPMVGGKGVFTAELESALRERQIDCAVHSLKDLPTEQPDGLVIGAIVRRSSPADVLISREGYTLRSLPQGARVGTSSYRRAAQLLAIRPDLRLIDIRGNVDTRIRKALDAEGIYDAIVLAYAGIERLDHTGVISEVLSLEQMLPAPGQGAIAVQARQEPSLIALISSIHHKETALAVIAERAFLAGLGGGCSVPVAAYGQWENNQLQLFGRVCNRNGSGQINVVINEVVLDEGGAHAAGIALAAQAVAEGAEALMDDTDA